MLVNYDHEHVTKPKRIVIDPLNQKHNEYYKDSEYNNAVEFLQSIS